MFRRQKVESAIVCRPRDLTTKCGVVLTFRCPLSITSEINHLSSTLKKLKPAISCGKKLFFILRDRQSDRQCDKASIAASVTLPTTFPARPHPFNLYSIGSHHVVLQVRLQFQAKTSSSSTYIKLTCFGGWVDSFFKTLTNHIVTVELKNDIRIRGTLKSVDQYLNIKLDDVDVLDLDKYPHLSSVKNMFIRGSVVRYVVLPSAEVDRGLLEDATRRGSFLFFFLLL